jgi:hypothetical protein
VGVDRQFEFRQKLLGEDRSVRRGVVMVKQSGLFSPNFGATSSHVFTKLPQNFTAEPRICSLACWDKFTVLPQLLYRWWHQSRIFWILPHISQCLLCVVSSFVTWPMDGACLPCLSSKMLSGEWSLLM